MITELFKLRVLIVEDDPSHVQMIRHMIERLGYENHLVHFESGRDALNHLEKCLSSDPPEALPNLIIMDLKLPGEDGLAILKKIKEHPSFKNIPAILNSSYAEAGHISETYRMESTFFIAKDYDLASLEEAIKALKIWGRF